MFQLIRPLANSLMGGHWKGNTLQFGLVAENAVSIRYFFYSQRRACNPSLSVFSSSPGPSFSSTSSTSSSTSSPSYVSYPSTLSTNSTSLLSPPSSSLKPLSSISDPFFPQHGDEHSLLSEVYLDETYQFGEVWGWEAVFENIEEVLLAYLIQIVKTDGSTHFVMDPYAKESSGGEQWGTPLGFEVDPEELKLRVYSRPSGPIFPGLRRLPLLRPESYGDEAIEPRPVRPRHSLEESIVYECHLRGMTRGHLSPGINSQIPGTYRGLAECIPHLKSLGVTAIELLPVFDFDENEKTSATENEQDLLNYWGYSPLLFFAPKQNYAADVDNPVREFKAMVDKFHEADLEIWLDVVFNHTAEFGENGPTDHFKILAPEQWYLLEKGGSYKNYTGCGNTLQCAHPTTRRLIRDCLQYWSHVIGVDGFRFDLATILNRNEFGDIMDFPQFLWELRNDPSLKDIKLISEPWDAAGGYELGKAACLAGWAEWNDQYRDTLRRAVRGDEEMMEGLKGALLGSPMVFGSVEEGRKRSINFVTSHDGMTLMDLVSYSEKHNEANGEENHDGHSTDYSDNCGVEGVTNNPEIQALRFRKLRMFHCLQLLSNGIPLLVGGDEFGRTQLGNNNAYCHDSSLTWLDWSMAGKNYWLLVFVRRMISLRKQHASFLFSQKSNYQWFNASGGPEEFAPYVRTLHFEVTNSTWPEQAIRILINCFDQPVKFELPEEIAWRVLIDTEKEPSECVSPVEGNVWLEGFSVQVVRG